ncbi:MAG TPA: hypothetical protein VKS44_16850 [Candidatus Acidoferrales bacterium]|nr:hypothetical protein [Candidatus Acidoferrales bacterium]
MAGEKRAANETRIVLQVGSELRIKNNGDIVVDNPELELAGDTQAADAVLMYRLDAERGEHVLRLVRPVAVQPEDRLRRGA